MTLGWEGLVCSGIARDRQGSHVDPGMLSTESLSGAEVGVEWKFRSRGAHTWKGSFLPLLWGAQSEGRGLVHLSWEWGWLGPSRSCGGDQIVDTL